MKKPAARMFDTTAHGGVILLGLPTVRIGGQPAARVSDMHSCPMLNVNVPHVGGPIQLGSATVKIGGLAAARVGDPLVCSGGPPDTIAAGCNTVLIGDGTSAGAGAGGGSASASAVIGALSTRPEAYEEEPTYPYLLFSPEAAGYAEGDTFTLESTDGSYAETLAYTDAERYPTVAALRFPMPPAGLRYSLRVDRAARSDGDGPASYHIFQDELLLRHTDEPTPSRGSRLRP